MNKAVLLFATLITVAPVFSISTVAQNTPETQGATTPTNETTPSSAVQSDPSVASSRQAASLPATLQDGFPIPPGIVRISGGMATGFLLKKKEPSYPEEARKAHVEGAVIFVAIINADGKIVHLMPISGPDMLRKPSLDVVSKWTYRPYVLNGKPVPIETTINVTYAFNH